MFILVLSGRWNKYTDFLGKPRGVQDSKHPEGVANIPTAGASDSFSVVGERRQWRHENLVTFQNRYWEPRTNFGGTSTGTKTFWNSNDSWLKYIVTIQVDCYVRVTDITNLFPDIELSTNRKSGPLCGREPHIRRHGGRDPFWHYQVIIFLSVSSSLHFLVGESCIKINYFVWP